MLRFIFFDIILYFIYNFYAKNIILLHILETKKLKKKGAGASLDKERGRAR